MRVTASGAIEMSTVVVTANNEDVTDNFQISADNSSLEGLVENLQTGENIITSTAPGVSASSLTLTNHPVSGPVISGPQQQPFFCQTDQFRVFASSETLGQALDENCSIATQIDFAYFNTSNEFSPLDPELALPADIAQTTDSDGRTIPYVVRIETGTINRAVFQIAMVDDLTSPGPTLTERDPGWNERLVYQFGGGCRGGWYRQGAFTGGVLDDKMLSQGFAVASASLNVFANNCNDLLASETMMMVKEHFVETYGLPRYTIGRGCSGGSYQLHQIADNYPGLLDGILPECSFPDVGFATTHTLVDARLLDNYFRNNAGLEWENEQRRIVSGFGSVGSLSNLAAGAARIDPVPGRADGRSSSEFDAVVPDDVRYEPQLRPAGARATIYDHTINAYGEDPASGFARRPLDNVGIQYGFDALNNGDISVAQFLDLNERIGGFDNDANYVAERMVADSVATRNAYRTGRLLSGSGGLSSVPILDYDYFYTDLEPGGDIHMRFQHFATRERLIAANGNADNHIMWSGGGNFAELAANGQRFNDIQRLSLSRMDEWLSNIEADTAAGTAREKTIRNKPADLVDGCFTREDNPVFIEEPQIFGAQGSSRCNDLYPAFPAPRQVAGGPLANDIIKCQLKPVELDDYSVALTAEEQTRLFDVFAQGVCDWTVPGVDQSDPDGPWLTFTDVGSYELLTD